MLSTTVKWVLYSLTSLNLYDVLFASKFEGRWFNVHFFGNMIVSACALPDVIRYVNSPYEALIPSENVNLTSIIPVTMILATHLYHIIKFNLTSEDKFHHYVFIPFVCLPGCIFSTTIPKQINFISFFMSGFPGGIIYGLLTCVKNGWITRDTERRMSMYINNYIRMPGLLFGVFTTYCAWANGHVNGFIATPLCSLIAYNAIYYNMLSTHRGMKTNDT